MSLASLPMYDLPEVRDGVNAEVPENGEHYFQEVHVTSEHNYHFAKTIKKGRAVIMLVTKKVAPRPA